MIHFIYSIMGLSEQHLYVTQEKLPSAMKYEHFYTEHWTVNTFGYQSLQNVWSTYTVYNLIHKTSVFLTKNNCRAKGGRA